MKLACIKWHPVPNLLVVSVSDHHKHESFVPAADLPVILHDLQKQASL